MEMIEDIRQALEEVIDPELGINIVDLGLIYDIREDAGQVEIEMTLTSPGCPLIGVIEEQIKEAVANVKGVKGVSVELVWDPPWGTHLMSEEARAELGIE